MVAAPAQVAISYLNISTGGPTTTTTATFLHNKNPSGNPQPTHQMGRRRQLGKRDMEINTRDREREQKNERDIKNTGKERFKNGGNECVKIK